MACSPTLTLLAEARKAYHDLMLGRSARVVVDGGGERVEFTAARKADLYAYIKELEAKAEAECPGSSGTATTGTPINGPLTFVF